MRANELMMEDWVRYKSSKNPVIIKDYRQLDGIETDYYEPIPLTNEILENNEFEYVEDDTYIYKYTDQQKLIRIYLDDWKNNTWAITISVMDRITKQEFKYMAGNISINVHELQHILKICKIEKEIVL